MDSFAEKCLENPITRRMGNPLWAKHIHDHREFLLKNSTPIKIPDHIFHTDRHRPIVVIRKLTEVDTSDIFTVLRLNEVSISEGLQEHHSVLLIPREDVLLEIKESFLSTLS